MITITLSKNFKDLARLKMTDRELMREIGLLARETILRRTRQGLDETGASFQPYSPSYAAQKGKALGAGTVNLTVSGAMLNAITIVEVTENTVTLGFSS